MRQNRQREGARAGRSSTSAQSTSLPYQVFAVKRLVVGPVFALLEACMVREAKQQPTATDFISRGLTHNHARKNSTTASAVHGTVAACILTHMQCIRRTWRPKNRRTRHTGREGSVASIWGGLGPGVRKILRIAALVQSAMLSARLAASFPVIRSPVTIRQRLSTRTGPARTYT